MRRRTAGGVAAAAMMAAAGAALAGPGLASPAPAGPAPEAPVVTDGAQPLQGAAPTEQDLSRLSLEELALVQVTSVSRRPEALAEAAAAIFVISADDIRRSGATSLPEVLRLAPNLNVQRVNAVDYAISARGFNGFEPSNKLLVLLDGRTLYSTLSSGVFWDAREVMLADIERIEVISGPGGALYGSNAMNGVINIISKEAAATVGTLIHAAAGNEDAVLTLRQGGSLGETGAWRAYARAHWRDDSLRFDGTDATDEASGLRAGARADWSMGENRLTLQGDAFDNEAAVNEGFSGEETRVSGHNVLARWARPLAGGELQVQAFYDRFERAESGGVEDSDTWDVLAQHSFARGRHQVVVGAGYRTVQSRFVAAPGGAFLDPPERTLGLTNVFVQDQIALTDALVLTLGAKFENNSFSGEQFLPNARLAWRRTSGDLAWAAVSRASRTPNRIERDLTLPGFLVGGDFQSETLTAWEVGYRARPRERLSFSISAFYNVYDDLRTASFTPVTVFPITLTNFGEGESWGVEAWGSYDLTPRWRLSAGLSALEKDFAVDPDGMDISGLASVGDDPAYQLLLKSQSQITDAVDLDIRLRAVDALEPSGVDGYVEADVRLGWRVSDRLELSLSGQNLIDDRRIETGDPARARAFGRSVLVALRADF